MVESYYTDEMRRFVATLDNPDNVMVDVSIMSNIDGPYIVLYVDSKQWDGYDLVSEGAAKYLSELRNGLIDRGARVSYWFGSS
jgi:hypothetical protein